jgi:large subunit ribosomal protein L7/L12
MSSDNPRLEKLLEKQKQIQNRIKQIQLKENAERRKFETRRKILLGVMFHQMIVEGRIPNTLFNEFLNKQIKTERDREVFDGYLKEFSTWKPKT